MRASVAALVARKIGSLQIGSWLATRPAKLAWEGGVVSFTFDDFPKSALTNGGSILANHGLRGTYYTALKLAGTQGNLGRMFDAEDVLAAHAAGHEIACHTYTHLDCCQADAASVVEEVRENGAKLSALLCGAQMTNFAYPYGAVSISAKRAVANRFASSRGTGQGINCGTVDLADLLGTRIYDCAFDRAALRALIDRTRAIGGWLIFYTHDVSDTPSEFGCKPDQLEEIVAYAAERSEVLPVRDVAARLGFGHA